MYPDTTVQIIHADVMDGLRQIPDQSVQCVVTSPPYWGLRDYGIEGQIGLEKTPEEYVQRMVEVFREVKRVLRDDGTIWLNLGDCYAGGGRGGNDGLVNHPHWGEYSPPQGKGNTYIRTGVLPHQKPKDLVGIPWRVAFALQADGWYLRSDIIWSKPNPMPESVTDRPTKSHEYIFLLTKKARYFYDADAVREAHKDDWYDRASTWREERAKGIQEPQFHKIGEAKPFTNPPNPAGRNRRTVWEIATQPFPAAHFATFPEALVEPCIKAGTSERGCCPSCGAPWVRETEPTEAYRKIQEQGAGWGGQIATQSKNVLHNITPDERKDGRTCGKFRGSSDIKTIGWQPSCPCSTDTAPCTVLDPFGGSGTVAKVARDLNRKAILIEINPAYIKIARKRLRLNEQLFVGGIPYVS